MYKVHYYSPDLPTYSSPEQTERRTITPTIMKSNVFLFFFKNYI